MAFQKYDFVGVSSTPLPYVHASFPAGQKLGTVKYCTMRSLHRGKDAQHKNSIQLRGGPGNSETKELVDLKLPKLELKSSNNGSGVSNFMSPRRHYGNIYKQKAYCKLKGIPISKMYKLNRAKPEKNDEQDEVPKLDAETKKKSVSLTFLELKEPEHRVQSENTYLDNEYSFLEGSESPWSRCRLRELDDESPIPGFRSKKFRNGRKLGNVVSSRRLQQLLDNEDTLDPYSFYMF